MEPHVVGDARRGPADGKELNLPVRAAVAGAGFGELAGELAGYNLERVYAVSTSCLRTTRRMATPSRCEQLIEQAKPAPRVVPAHLPGA